MGKKTYFKFEGNEISSRLEDDIPQYVGGGNMKKEQLTRRKIFMLTSQHRFYTNFCWIMATICVIAEIYGKKSEDRFYIDELLIVVVALIIIGFLCCLIYFIDILTMNIKTVEEGSRELLAGIYHGKETVGAKIKVISPNEGAKKLAEYDKVRNYSYERARINSRYDYKVVWYYLALSKVVVFKEYISIGEAKKYNPKKRRYRNKN
jgi:hypothetical protein